MSITPPSQTSPGDLSRQPSKSRTRLRFFLKLLVSAVFLVYVFQKVGWRDVWTELRGADPFFLALYVVLGLLATFVSALKWFFLSRSHGITASLSRLFWLYLVGYFFNHILPTSVGGDVVRGYELGKTHGNHAEAMASVFMERFTGLTILVLFATLALVLDTRFLGDIRILASLGVVLVGYVAIILMILYRPFFVFVDQYIPIKAVKKVLKKIKNFQEAVYTYRYRKATLANAILLSILFYINSVFIAYVGCLSFNYHVLLSDLFVAIPIILVIFMMPISLGGIGVQEWAYYFVLGMVGVPGAVGLSLGLLYRARAIVFGLIGALVYPMVSTKEQTSKKLMVNLS